MDIKKIIDVVANSDDFYSFKQLCQLAECTNAESKSELNNQLELAISKGLLIADRRNNRYCGVTDDAFIATVDATKGGYVFLQQQGAECDWFVRANATRGALHRDKVLARRVPGTRDGAEIISIVEHGITELVGVYDKKNFNRFVIPSDERYRRDIYIVKDKDMDAVNGQKVVVKITNFPTDSSRKPEGEIIQVLGFAGEYTADMQSIAHSHGIKMVFSDRAIARATKVSGGISEADIEGRLDLRGEQLITIDGADAKDLDDAVSLTVNADGTYNLGVHIADVANYVKVGDDVDTEAFRRGNSTYLPDTVYPMLPTELSNGICSLYSGVDRLTMSCIMHVSQAGEVIDYKVAESVINTAHRMTYDEVQSILDGETIDKYSDVTPMLHDMAKLASTLIERREQAGNIDFVSNEVTFVKDAENNVTDILPYQDSFSHHLIEQFMVLANEMVAEFLTKSSVPCVYRVHEQPDEEKFATLSNILLSVGIKIDTTDISSPKCLQTALKASVGTPQFKLINTVMLRTMSKAKYSATNAGHYGLASKCYCHFTSPIRRYSDLVVHRLLKIVLSDKATERAISAYQDICDEASIQCSVCEKKSSEAERKAVDYLRCKYASTLLGQKFTGSISGVLESGIFVELENTIEGFVSIDQLARGLVYQEKQFALVGDSMTYRIGDSIEVIIASSNPQTGRIDMALEYIEGLAKNGTNKYGHNDDESTENNGDKQVMYNNDKPSRYKGDRPARREGDRPARREGDRPARNYGDKPARSYGDKPARSYGDRPARQEGDRPARSYGDKPARSYGDKPARREGDRPARNYGDKPARSYGDKPARSYGDRPARQEGDRPARSYGEKPARSYGDKPARSYGDKPARSYGDRPARQEGDRPARSYGDRPARQEGDRPARSYGDKPARNYGDKPARSYGDKPARSYGDKPARSYGDRPARQEGDRPARSYGDKPARSYGDKPARREGDRPARSYGDKPARSYGDRPARQEGDRPARSYGDKPARSYGDKPARSYGDKPRYNNGDRNGRR